MGNLLNIICQQHMNYKEVENFYPDQHIFVIVYHMVQNI